MFYSRAKEIKLLQGLFDGQAICLYGKRRVGKTALIKEVLRGRRCIYYECTKDTLERNLEQFVIEAKRSNIDIPSYIHFSSFLEAFQYLSKTNEVEAIAIDEYPYLKEFEKSEVVDSIFQNIVDSISGKMGILLSGSAIGSMKDLLQPGNPLYGRFNQTICLPEFNYLEASQFYPDKSVYDKVAFYAVFGGSPYVNRSIDPSLSLKENIIHTFLRFGSEVYNYSDNLLLTDTPNALHAQRILSVVANTKKRYSEIVSSLDKNKTGILARPLGSLLQSNVIRLVSPINHRDDKKKAFYEIADNALRFYYAYIYPNKSRLTILGEEAFYDQYIAPTITSFVSLRFEEIARSYFSILSHRGKLLGIKDIGTYYYDDAVHHENGEFDVALALSAGYAIYEVKYLQGTASESLIKSEAQSILSIKELDVKQIGFISINGFETKNKDYHYITGEDLYSLDI